MPECYIEKTIKIGCNECKKGCESGNCEERNGSVDVRFYLGNGKYGVSAGELRIFEETPSWDIGTPKTLKFNTVIGGIEKVYSPDGNIWQILALDWKHWKYNFYTTWGFI